MANLNLEAPAPETAPASSPAFDRLAAAAAAAIAIWISWVAVELAGDALALGPLSQHMVHHILLMNAAAPFIAYVVARSRGLENVSGRRLAAATAAQIVVLWGWHAPPVLASAFASPLVMTAMHVSLLLVSTAFWLAVQGTRDSARWGSILAVLVTGKLFCLLAVILTLSPRPLYAMVSGGHGGHGGHSLAGIELADQQLAGLLMIIACPLTYVLAGVVIASRWLIEIERSPASHHSHGSARSA